MSGLQPKLDENSLPKIVRGIIDLFQGRGNHSGTFTCATSAATTTVSHPNCSINSVITFSPATANAAAEIQNGTIYILATNISNGSFKVTHANNATAGRTFYYNICS